MSDPLQVERDCLEGVRVELGGEKMLREHFRKTLDILTLDGTYPDTKVVAAGTRVYDESPWRVVWPLWGPETQRTDEDGEPTLDLARVAGMIVDDINEA